MQSRWASRRDRVGNATYTIALTSVGTNGTRLTLGSRESANKPQLVLTQAP